MSEILNKPINENREAPIRAYLTYYHDGELVSAWQDFPTTSEEMEYNLGRSGIEAEHLTGILDTKYETAIGALDDNLPRKPDLDELNELAHRLDWLSDSERDVFGAVLEASMHKGSLTELINLTYNLDKFDFYPGHFSGKEFSGILFEMHASQHLEVRERLQASNDLSDKDFIAYVERLEQSVNINKYGTLARQSEAGTLTWSGYLLPLTDELPQTYTNPQDIPAEHRLTENIEERKPSLLGALAVAKEYQQQQVAPEAPEMERPVPSGPEL